MADKKPSPRHRVLYVKRSGDEFHPVASCDETDPNSQDLFLAVKVEEINKARHGGAPVPEFKIVTECEGKAVEEVKGGK